MVAVHGLAALEGDTAFAFFVVRLRDAVDRDGLARVLRHFSALIPDADAFIDELPDPLDEDVRLFGMPWQPPEGDDLAEQRRLVEEAGAVDVEAAWFFQTGTSLPAQAMDEDESDADEEITKPLERIELDD